MLTPFDRVVEDVVLRRYHNQRLQSHSDIVSEGIFEDLKRQCPALREDIETSRVQVWMNIRAPGGRERKIDLFIGEPSADGKPDINRIRLAVENKSVITAHRNRTTRLDDLRETLEAVLKEKPEVVIAATVMIGLAPRVLNVADCVAKRYRKHPDLFERNVLPRLSSGDDSLWTEFEECISDNTVDDPHKTLALFRRKLPLRDPRFTHEQGYDVALYVPVQIDNVNPPQLPRPSVLGIDVDAEYNNLLRQLCSAYTMRWHA